MRLPPGHSFDVPYASQVRFRQAIRPIGNWARTAEPKFSAWANNLHPNVQTWGPRVGAGMLGLMAIGQTRNMVDRMRYGQYGGAMLSAGLAGASAAAAFRYGFTQNALKSDISRALKFIGTKIR